MKNSNLNVWRSKFMLPLLAGCLTATLVGCSSNVPKPVAEIASAQASLQSATSDEATQYAPVAMDRAKDKLRRAQQAVQDEDYTLARRLAEEAKADADLAQAVTDKVQAEREVAELETNIEMIRDEIRRAQVN